MAKIGDASDQVDLSFMVSKFCDLRCTFCMYSSGPEVEDHVDMAALRRFIATVDHQKIVSVKASTEWMTK
jgi:molybdenum cofactor biosynthesis enzyme MoaA